MVIQFFWGVDFLFLFLFLFLLFCWVGGYVCQGGSMDHYRVVHLSFMETDSLGNSERDAVFTLVLVRWEFR